MLIRVGLIRYDQHEIKYQSWLSISVGGTESVAINQPGVHSSYQPGMGGLCVTDGEEWVGLGVYICLPRADRRICCDSWLHLKSVIAQALDNEILIFGNFTMAGTLIGIQYITDRY